MHSPRLSPKKTGYVDDEADVLPPLRTVCPSTLKYLLFSFPCRPTAQAKTAYAARGFAQHISR